jgi:3-hydroxyisobutyrate dehydrogenase-like beta-hydroxyacid dehydrogenase
MTKEATSRPAVAWLGTGIMGAPMAGRLAHAGHGVRAWNRTFAKAEALTKAGVTAAATPGTAVQGADIVALCLTDAEAVEACLFGPSGAARSMEPDALVVDFSTIGIEATRRLAARLEQDCGATWLDAPVSGGPGAAQEGRLAIFCGGRPQDFENAEPILALLGRNRTLMGPLGAGQATKMCNQLIVSAEIIAIAEAVALAEILGVDTSRLGTALAGGYADSPALAAFAPRMAAQALEPKISEINTMLKDVRAINEMAAASPISLPLAGTAQAILESAATRGFAEADLAILSRLAAHAPRPSRRSHSRI